MPPKCKFTKEEIIQATLDIVRSEGIDAVTARALGAKLGTSPKPIFTFFDSMDDLLQATILAAKDLYTSYALQGLHSDPSIPGLWKSPGFGNDKPLQYSCLENPMDRGVW